MLLSEIFGGLCARHATNRASNCILPVDRPENGLRSGYSFESGKKSNESLLYTL